MAGADVWQGYLRTLTTGTPYEGEPFAYEEVVAGLRQRSVYSVRAVKLGDALVVTWVAHDDAARQQALLADLQRLGNLGWTDWNLVTGAITWSPQVHAVLDRDPEEGPLPLDAFPRDVLPEDAPDFTRALRRLLDAATPSIATSGSRRGAVSGTCGSSPRRCRTPTAPPSKCTASSRTSQRSAPPNWP
ncbi:hypothetical protein ACFQ2B_34250 [Streptomyces stramineus]